MKFLRKAFAACCIAASAAHAGDLDAVLQDAAFWTSDARTLAGKYPELKFAWNTTDHSSARLVEQNRLFDTPLAEVTFEMRDEKPTGMNVVFYNRGDSGEMSREMFGGLVSNTQRRITEWMGARGTVLNDQLKTTGVRRDGLLWMNANFQARLTWAYSTKDPAGHLGFRAEYVKMTVAPAGAKTGQPLAGGTVSAGALKSKIKRETNGDVALNGVPMVDQGEKGYCAVASAERVMRFYGMNVDQHELAQLAASSAEGGTDPRAMLESLRRVGIKLGCKVKVIEDFSVQEFVRLIERYNTAAKKKKLPPITYGQELNLAEIYMRMDTEVLRDIRTKSPGELKSFMADIAKNIDAATPVLWGVQLGKVDEKPVLPKQIAGGHMRLIIGYNPKTSEILYTDSWGPGHELKRMNLEDAWTITCSLYAIEPRRTTI
jgi:hypothetical protein